MTDRQTRKVKIRVAKAERSRTNKYTTRGRIRFVANADVEHRWRGGAALYRPIKRLEPKKSMVQGARQNLTHHGIIIIIIIIII